MKRFLIIAMMILSSLLLIACASRNPNPQINVMKTNLTEETWRSRLCVNPQVWLRGVDCWFLKGLPNDAEIANRNAASREAISTMQVNIPEFTKLKLSGDFQVQIFGTYNTNTVYVYGPNAAVHHISVTNQGNTLVVQQLGRVPQTMRRVIVRIGMNNLRSLTQLGCGRVEAIQIRSPGLVITTGPMAKGPLWIAGHLRLFKVLHMGSGTLNVFGVNTPSLMLANTGAGTVNISGKACLKNIQNTGSGKINVIGATGGALKIASVGSGRVSVSGNVSLQEVRATNRGRVYVNGVNSNYLHVFLANFARVGLAGRVQNLYVDALNNSIFLGRYLCAQNSFVKVSGAAHASVTGNTKIFASANSQSSIYFYGSPNVLSKFVSGHATILPIENAACSPYPFLRPQLTGTYPSFRSSPTIINKRPRRQVLFKGAG